MKPKGLEVTLIALGLAISTRPMQGQTMSFFRQFTTPGMEGVAADASGIYVVGGGVRKYDARGNELWSREAAPGTWLSFGSAAADATGVYVAGVMPSASGQTAIPIVRKYSAGGNELWTRQVDFELWGGVAADATGVYVAGRRPMSPACFCVRKYSPDGAELWTVREPVVGLSALAYGIAVDATGLYVVGRVAGVNFLRKFDSRGNQLWNRQLDTPGRVAADATGVYVVTLGGFSLNKYDAGGNALWTRQLATPLGAYPIAVAADGSGVYVVGRTSFRLGPPLTALPGQCRSGSGGDSFVRKYDPAGAELWTREFGTSEAAWANGVAVDASGVYVSGQEGTAVVLDDDDNELYEVFRAVNPTSGAFLAKFEKSAAVVTEPGPRIFPDCVVNAASYVGGGVAPGEIVTLFGSAMGPPDLVRLRLTDDRRLATTLADTRVLFDGVPAPLLYVSDKQSSAIVPYAVAGRTSVELQVEYKGARSDPVTVPVLASRPGIFSLDGSGQGQGAILNEDGSPNSPSNPAERGSIVSIYGTGGGEAAQGVVDGQILSAIVPRTTLPVSVSFFAGPNEPWKQGEVLYAGGSSGSVAGLLQVNVRVPANAWAGDRAPLALIIGSHWTLLQSTIALR